MRTLNEVGLAHGTDKASSTHDFLNFYERRFQHLRQDRFVLIEVGVLRGSSVRTWSEYFPDAQIVGVDVDEACRTHEGRNIAIRIGDASDPAFLFDIIREFGRPMIVIDDGSHRWDHQIACVQTLFPLVAPGGFYVVEDLDTSFEAHLKVARFEGHSSISAFDYLAKLARRVVADAAFGDEKRHDLFVENFYEAVGSVEFARRTCVVSKKPAGWRGPV